MSVKETLKDAGHKVAEKVEQATDWVKEKTGMGSSAESNGIKEHMDVIGSCGNKVGVVDHVEGRTIKLTRSDSPDGQHHFIPMDWVARVDSHVHLNRDCGAAKREWHTSAA